MRSKATCLKKPVIIARIIKTPIRALSKAKDLYIKGITNFSSTYSRPTMIMETTSTAQHLPRSFSAAVISNNATVTEISIADLVQQRSQHQLGASRKGVPRSCSVGMGRIDEDRVSSFRNDNIIVKNKLRVNDKDAMPSRNRSYARVSTKIRQF